VCVGYNHLKKYVGSVDGMPFLFSFLVWKYVFGLNFLQTDSVTENFNKL